MKMEIIHLNVTASVWKWTCSAAFYSLYKQQLFSTTDGVFWQRLAKRATACSKSADDYSLI